MSNHHHQILTTAKSSLRRLRLLIHRQKQHQKKKSQRMLLTLLMVLLFCVVLLRLMLLSSSSSPSSQYYIDKGSSLSSSSSSSSSSTTSDTNLRHSYNNNNNNNNNNDLIDTETTIQIGEIGSTSFSLTSKQYDSWWHDVPMKPTTIITSSTSNHNNNSNIVNMIIEIPFGTTSKMEMDKSSKNNPIKQDLNNDGSLRYYTYGKTFFNYGFVPQTWEDPSDLKKKIDVVGQNNNVLYYGGDNDPIDIIEVGSTSLKMGSIVPCRIIGGYELIDQNEIDYKIICVAVDVEDEDEDEDATRKQTIQSLDDLEYTLVEKLKDWFINYKTTDGKQPNKFVSTDDDIPLTPSEAMKVIEKTHNSWRSQLCGGNKGGIYYIAANTKKNRQQKKQFWLSSPKCRG